MLAGGSLLHARQQQYNLSSHAFPQSFFAGLPVLSMCVHGEAFAVAGSNVDSAKFQMPTAAKQAFACIGMPARLGVND